MTESISPDVSLRDTTPLKLLVSALQNADPQLVATLENFSVSPLNGEKQSDSDYFHKFSDHNDYYSKAQ